MFENVFVGENAKKQPLKLLILGESHYESEVKIKGTDSVVRYLALNENTENKTQFYKNIMKSFGYNVTQESKKYFWNNFFCGNYVSDLCGKRENNDAIKKIRDNKQQYNDELFRFVNENDIDIIFCFSRLVYNNLPNAAINEKEVIKNENSTNYLKIFTYKENCEHKNCSVTLKKPLTVYGLKHPCSSFSPTEYVEYLKQYSF